MFKVLIVAVVLGLAVAPSYTLKPEPRSDLTCEICTLVLQAAETLIAKNETEDKIISFIEKNLCGRLGSLNGTCVQFMETEGKEILYELSQGINPTIVCHRIGLCNARKLEIQLNTASLNCSICKLVMTQVKNMLNNNASEAEILTFIEDHICNFTGSFSSLCKTVITNYGPQILKLLANNVDPEKVCEIIGMCTNSTSTSTVTQKPNQIFCEFTASVLIEHLNDQYLLHEVETLLSHACTIHGTNGACMSFVETFTPIGLNLVSQNIKPNDVCEAFDFSPAKPQDKNAVTCELCTIVLTAAESFLAKNESEDKVLAFIEKELCGRLGSLNATCVNFLETEGRQILSDLVNGMNVSQVCKKFGLCAAHTRVEVKPEPKNPITCELCTLVLNAAESLLSKNESEDKVIAFIEKELCGRLGSLNATCVNFLETEGRQILNELVNGVNASQICQRIGLCALPPPPRVKENPIYCTLCQYVVEFVDNELKGNRTEAAIVNALDNVCKIIPQSLRNECNTIVNTYGIYLVQLLVEFADPLKVCQGVKLCD